MYGKRHSLRFGSDFCAKRVAIFISKGNMSSLRVNSDFFAVRAIKIVDFYDRKSEVSVRFKTHARFFFFQVFVLQYNNGFMNKQQCKRVGYCSS